MPKSLKKEKIRILLCGAGNRVFPKNPRTSQFRGWFATLKKSPHFEIVGVQDVAQASLTRASGNFDLDGIPQFLRLNEALEKTSCDAVLVCPIAEAHAEAAFMALEADCHLLIEKPMVTDLSDAARIEATTREKGLVVSVIQNWRAKSVGFALKGAVQSGKIGRPGNLFFRYVRDREHAHLPAYLFKQPYPLLYSMSIHHFDLFRFVLGSNITEVEGRGFTPPWSRYESPPAVHLFMVTENGVSISYTGTFSSKNRHIPQESLIIEGERGSLSNDSQWGDPPLYFSGSEGGETENLTKDAPLTMNEQYDLADDFYAEDFYQTIRLGKMPLCPPEDNIWTLAAIDAAVRACEIRKPVRVGDLIQEARARSPRY